MIEVGDNPYDTAPVRRDAGALPGDITVAESLTPTAREAFMLEYSTQRIMLADVWVS